MRCESVDRYWEEFVRCLPPEANRTGSYYDAFHIGITNDDATEIADLVLRRIKTATGSLQWVYEAEGNSPPKPGDLSIVLDMDDRPVCIIETTEVRVIPYDEVDEAFAYDGGERGRTLASWRELYWGYILSECARINREPTEKTPLVCERFRVVYREPQQGLAVEAIGNTLED